MRDDTAILSYAVHKLIPSHHIHTTCANMCEARLRMFPLPRARLYHYHYLPDFP